jgi:hypothetical protein
LIRRVGNLVENCVRMEWCIDDFCVCPVWLLKRVEEERGLYIVVFVGLEPDGPYYA